MTRTTSWPRVAHALALSAALAAVALAYGAVWMTPGLLAALASPFFAWQPRERARRILPRVSHLALATAFGSLFLSVLLPTLSVGPLPILAGVALAATACAFAFGPAAFPPGSTLAPAIAGLLAVAGASEGPAELGASRVPAFQAASHGGFAEVYVGLCAVAVVGLWTAALQTDGPRWTGRLLARNALLLVVAAAVAVVGLLGLPTAQPLVEKAIAGQLGQAETGLSGESRLGEFASLAVSQRRVVDVQAPASGGRWLLRAEVLTRFDGHRWTPAPPPGGKARPASQRRLLRPMSPVQPLPSLLADLGAWFQAVARPSARATALRFNQHVVDRWPLLLPRGIEGITADVSYLDIDDLGFFRRPLGLPLRLYGALVDEGSASSPPVPALDDHTRKECLALPSALDPRLRELASRLALGAPKASAKMERTLGHFASGYAYTLDPGAWGEDPLAEFVFDKRRGYCDYFASAAVVLLRLQGVPARFVKGLSVGPQNDYGQGLSVVRESDAHAWLEAWNPETGWVEADPTPAAAFASLHTPPGRLAVALEWTRAAAAEAWSRLTGPGPAAFARWLLRTLRGVLGDTRQLTAFAGLCLFGGAAYRLVRWLIARRSRVAPVRATTAAAVPAELLALVSALERSWARAGQPRPLGRGLRDHARCLAAAPPPQLPLPVAQVAERVIDAYYRARYGGAVPEEGERETLRTALRAAQTA